MTYLFWSKKNYGSKYKSNTHEYQGMKKFIYLSIVFFLKIVCIEAQNKKYSVVIDLLPLAYITTSGSCLLLYG